MRNQDEYLHHAQMVKALQRVGLCHSIASVQNMTWGMDSEEVTTSIGLTNDGVTVYIKGAFIAIAFESGNVSTEVYLHVLPGFHLSHPLVYLVDLKGNNDDLGLRLVSEPHRKNVPSWLVGRITLD